MRACSLPNKVYLFWDFFGIFIVHDKWLFYQRSKFSIKFQHERNKIHHQHNMIVSSFVKNMTFCLLLFLLELPVQTEDDQPAVTDDDEKEHGQAKCNSGRHFGIISHFFRVEQVGNDCEHFDRFDDRSGDHPRQQVAFATSIRSVDEQKSRHESHYRQHGRSCDHRRHIWITRDGIAVQGNAYCPRHQKLVTQIFIKCSTFLHVFFYHCD